MVIAEIKKITFISVENEYEAQLAMLEPVLEPEYRLTLKLAIGPQDSDEIENFLVHVVNIAWIKKQIAYGNYFIGVDSVMVDFIDYDELERELKILVKTIYGETWGETLKNLRKYFRWDKEYLQ